MKYGVLEFELKPDKKVDYDEITPQRANLSNFYFRSSKLVCYGSFRQRTQKETQTS